MKICTYLTEVLAALILVGSCGIKNRCLSGTSVSHLLWALIEEPHTRNWKSPGIGVLLFPTNQKSEMSGHMRQSHAYVKNMDIVHNSICNIVILANSQ